MVKKKITLTVCIVLTLCVLVCIVYKPIFYRLYRGDRIKGSVELTIDDKPCLLEENYFLFHEDGNVKTDGTAADISIHGGEYGKYTFEILDTPIGEPILISCFQFNWWNVQTFELSINIDTEQGELAYNGNCTTIAESGKRSSYPINGSQALDDENIKISFGY